MKTKNHISEVGEVALGIKGDFMFNPVTVEDGYGATPMKTLEEVKEQAAKSTYFSQTIPAKEVQEIEPSKQVNDKVAPVAVMNYVAPTPDWAKMLYVAGLPAGLLFAAYKNYGFWVYVLSGVVGATIGAIPYNYYKNK